MLRRVARLAAAGDGVVGGYVHAGGKLGVLVALESKGAPAEIAGLARGPLDARGGGRSVSRRGRSDAASPKELVDAERAIFRAQAEQSGKPANIVEKMVEGRVNKYYAEVCLLEQPFVKDPDRSIAKLLADESKRLGRPVAVTGFVRFKLGEALATVKAVFGRVVLKLSGEALAGENGFGISPGRPARHRPGDPGGARARRRRSAS